jgi:5'-methylthioadenosine phosphorylase
MSLVCKDCDVAESRWFASQGFTLVNMTEAVLARELEICYAAVALVTGLDAGIDAGSAVSAVDVFAEFERNLVPFKKLVFEAIDQVELERTCTHCLPHEGAFDLP